MIPGSVATITRSRFRSAMLGGGALALVLMIVSYPDQAFSASMQGLSIWWKTVFPALLPFLVLSEMMRAYGVMHGLGVMLDPLMRLLFRVPGVGGWALALGLSGGFPAGADAVAQLRKDGHVTRHEGERLLSVSHVSGPIFLIVVVGTGFFHNPPLGVLLAAVHIAAAIATGVVMRIVHRGDLNRGIGESSGSGAYRWPVRAKKRPFPLRILYAMDEARRRDGRSFGRLLGESVSNAVQTLMVIGGFMMMFSVFLKVAFLTYAAYAVQHLLLFALAPFGVTPQAAHQFMYALFELNLGSQALSEPAGMSAPAAIALVAAGIGWSGLCLHAQVRGIVRGTDLRYGPFLAGRIIHALLSAPLTLLMWPWYERISPAAVPSFAGLPAAGPFADAFAFPAAETVAIYAGLAVAWLCLLIAALIAASLLVHTAAKLLRLGKAT